MSNTEGAAVGNGTISHALTIVSHMWIGVHPKLDHDASTSSGLKVCLDMNKFYPYRFYMWLIFFKDAYKGTTRTIALIDWLVLIVPGRTD